MGFYQRRKHDKWREVEAPALEAAIADTHTHLHMMPDPAWELARAAANNVTFMCTVTDPTEEGTMVFDRLDDWMRAAEQECSGPVPAVRIAVGVHPHNARLYDETIEAQLMRLLSDERVSCLGEIGLDYHYDLSPRDVQRDVFRRQLQIAHQIGLPVSLHVREAHDEAFSILQAEGFPEAGCILHCCALPWDELEPWVDAGCHIAYGGALTFKKADAVRAAIPQVPLERLLTETDGPYMTPEPMRGTLCTPAHVVFTASCLADARGCAGAEERRAFLEQIYDNARALLDRPRGE